MLNLALGPEVLAMYQNSLGNLFPKGKDWSVSQCLPEIGRCVRYFLNE